MPVNLIRLAGPEGREITETNEVRRDGPDGEELGLMHTDGALQTSRIPTEAGMQAGSPDRKGLGAKKKTSTWRDRKRKLETEALGSNPTSDFSPLPCTPSLLPPPHRALTLEIRVNVHPDDKPCGRGNIHKYPLMRNSNLVYTKGPYI